MDNLRLVLIVCGVVLIVGIWSWDAFRRRALTRRRDRAGGEGPSFTEGEAALFEDDDGPRTGALDELHDDALGDSVGLGDLRALAEEHVGTASEGGGDAPSTPAIASGEEMLIVLSVMAPSGERFAGADLQRAFEQVGMRHGAMGIFHHSGLGPRRGEEPVFSAANVVEPGSFDLARMHELETPGVALFAKLPGELDPPVALELMLSTAQRLAEALGGELRDQRHAVLTPQALSHLREQVAQFARRLLLEKA